MMTNVTHNYSLIVRTCHLMEANRIGYLPPSPLYCVYTTEVGQTVLNRTVLALLYKPCWPGLAQLTSAQFYDCLHCQTNWADPCWPTKMCQCKRGISLTGFKIVYFKMVLFYFFGTKTRNRTKQTITAWNWN